MKKGLSLIILSLSIALFSLAGGTMPAMAASQQRAVSHRLSTVIRQTLPSHFHPRNWRNHYQYFHGNGYSDNNLNFRGHNLNNSGNQGYNRRYNRNFGANAGNLVINHGRASLHQRTYQYFNGNGYSRNRDYFVGYNQNNSGNQGDNAGINEDHGGNAGNQIAN